MISALKHAMPYIKMYKKKTFVIKAGGEVFISRDATIRFLEQIAILHNLGIRVVLIHGGGPQSSALEKALGLPTTMVEGRRVTDEQSLAVSIMVLNGQINTEILASCRDIGLDAVGISGVDCGLIRAHKRPLVQVGDKEIDYGFVGDIDSVDASIINKQLDSDLVPVISPLSSDEKGTLLNINADTVAAAIAIEIKAEKLILATGAPGILESVTDSSSLISFMSSANDSQTSLDSINFTNSSSLNMAERSLILLPHKSNDIPIFSKCIFENLVTRFARNILSSANN